jgi:hypothetical protein
VSATRGWVARVTDLVTPCTLTVSATGSANPTIQESRGANVLILQWPGPGSNRHDPRDQRILSPHYTRTLREFAKDFIARVCLKWPE